MNHQPKTQTPVVILVRVSSVKQQTDRQITELTQYATDHDYNVIEVIQESITGAAKKSDRSGLQRVEALAREGVIKKVLVHEVSRIARRNSIAHQFIETLEEFGVSVYWHSQKIETLLESGKRNPAASIMFSLLAELGRAERECLSERVISGQREAVRKGKTLGRPVGTTTPPDELLKKHSDIVRQLRRGKSNRDVAKIVEKGVSTVKRVRKLMKAA